MENKGTAKMSLEDILIFATGASEILPMGFDEQPSVAFKPKGEAGGLPSASTCANRLYLPLYDAYDTFNDKVLFGFSCAIGFGNECFTH